MDVLDKIVESKRRFVEAEKQQKPLSQVMREAETSEPCRGFRKALENSPTGIIAEFKRHSPSAGWINKNAKPEEVVPQYQAAGAACCSVLTDEEFFKGSAADFAAARKAASLPLLRKDFIIDEYQVYQTKAMGADAMLLIAAELTLEQCYRFAALARQLGLDTILEVHDEKELQYLNEDISILGVNNRHLGTFHTDVEYSFAMAEKMKTVADKSGCRPLLISESGIKDYETVKRLKAAGFQGFLIGGSFMKAENPASELVRFLNRQ